MPQHFISKYIFYDRILLFNQLQEDLEEDNILKIKLLNFLRDQSYFKT